MSNITLSSAVRTNLSALQRSTDLMSKTQERLATGLKVNSALDDPTAFFTASALNSRANQLNRLLDSVGNALQTVVAADKGLNSIIDLVESAKSLAIQALQSPGPVSEVIGSADAAFDPQNDIVDTGILQDDTLSITIGNNSTLDITFGTGAG